MPVSGRRYGIIANPALWRLGRGTFRSRPLSTQRTGSIAGQAVAWDLGGTAASQAVAFDIYTPHTTLYWPMLTLSSAGSSRACEPVCLGSSGCSAAPQDRVC